MNIDDCDTSKDFYVNNEWMTLVSDFFDSIIAFKDTFLYNVWLRKEASYHLIMNYVILMAHSWFYVSLWLTHLSQLPRVNANIENYVLWSLIWLVQMYLEERPTQILDTPIYQYDSNAMTMMLQEKT